MKKNILFAVVVLIVVSVLYFLSLENVVPIPADDTHAGIQDEEQCFDCHGEGREYARKKDHPPKDQCLKCHRRVEKESQ